ncbi:MAG: MOSC domain-containing protein [Nitrospira sp.]|nr:MAG: MOSC domain-containing protein [Nitrospira sp.]
MQQITGLIRSIQVGLPEDNRPESLDDQPPQPWSTGIFKRPVRGPIRLRQQNLEGDGQADLIHHGGLDKAVCVYPSEHWFHWSDILPQRQMIGGEFGENFTLEGLTETDVCIGDVFSVGSAVVQISQPRQPCWKLARRWQIKNLAVQVQQTGFTGWYFRVLQEGLVESKTPLRLLDRPYPEWTVTTANRIMHQEQDNLKAAEHLSLCPLLSSSWQHTLRQRSRQQNNPDPQHRQFGNPL